MLFCALRLMLLFAVFALIAAPHAGAVSWPVHPDSNIHTISATYGMWLDASPPFMHSGIDIAEPVGTPVYAIEPGWVKTITTTGGYSSWRVVVGDSANTSECEAWMYAHLHEMTIPVFAGQYVNEGDLLGYVVDWYDPNITTHLHLSRIRYHGTAYQWADEQDDWVFVENPLDLLPADYDSVPPVLLNALGDQLLAFCENETSDYFAEGAPISGDVDIIARAYDYYNWYGWEYVPYSMEYKIEGDTSIPWMLSACFTGPLGTYAEMAAYTYIVYKDDHVCNSQTGGDEYIYYFTLTNNDGDTLVESNDADLCWQTLNFPNGDYTVFVRATDKWGNMTVDSMTVTVGNFFDLTGTVDISDGKPFAGIVTVASTGTADTCDETGAFAVSGISTGSQTITAARLGYLARDTILMMYENKHIDFVLEPCPYLRGDPNDDGNLNVGDAVFIINHVFKGGDPPDPPAAGDANCDGSLNVGDAVFMINYVFKGGVAPCPDCL